MSISNYKNNKSDLLPASSIQRTEQRVQLLVYEAGRALMLARAVHHIGLGVGARVHLASVRVERENVSSAALGTDRQPATVAREAHVAHFGARVASIQRVQVLDDGARRLERVDVYLKHVEVLTERVG